MVIKTDEEAASIIGSQVYTISENKFMPMTVNSVIMKKRFSGISGVEIETQIVTALGEYDSEMVFADKDEIINYIDSVIES